MRSLEAKILAGITLALSTAAGCSDGTGTGGSTNSTSSPTYIRDIKPLVDAKCGNCHVAGGIAPFALTTYEQVNTLKGAVEASVVAKTMPPWSASNDCTTYLGDRSLTDAQIDSIVKWVAAGGPEGDPADKPVTVENNSPSLSRVDLELPIPVAYTPTVIPDEYRCFVLDWPEQETAYLTGLGVEPGHVPIVHHVIAFLAKPNSVAAFQALDDADPGPGYPCYGGPGGPPGSNGWLGAWVPGSTGRDYPAGTGIEIPVGSKVIVQMHYNMSSAPAAPDQTKVLMRVDKTVEKKAAIMPFTNFMGWIQQKQMTIPANTKDVSHEFSLDPTIFVGPATGNALPTGVPLSIYSGGLHMHTRGKSSITTIRRPDETEACLLDIPQWDFHWQGDYRLENTVRVNPGDKLWIKCTWDNTDPFDINWGEGTNDEMCLGTYYVTE